MNFEPCFDLARASELATEYIGAGGMELEDEIVNEISPRVKRDGFYTKSDIEKLCYWKSPRSSGRASRNDEDFVREVTSSALHARNERMRVEALRLLDGVDWPTASVLLHFGHSDDYPILDFRALESLGREQPSAYDFEFWWKYVSACRTLKQIHGLKDMRTLDRALWQYSKKQSQTKRASS